MRAAILVEYAPVEIGNRTYDCPVHGVAFSKVPIAAAKGDAVEIQTQLNDVVFTNYHLFGSEARIVTGASGNSPPDGTGANPTAKPEDAAPATALPDGTSH